MAAQVFEQAGPRKEETIFPLTDAEQFVLARDLRKRIASGRRQREAAHAAGDWTGASSAAGNLEHSSMLLSYAERGLRYDANAARRNAERADAYFRERR